MPNNLALYQLTDEYLRLMELAADPEADEESFALALAEIQGSMQEKGIAVAQMIRNFEASASQIREAAASLTARAAKLEQSECRLRQYLKQNMEKAGIRKIESPYLIAAIKQNQPRVIVDDNAPLDGRFLRHEPESWHPDKAELRRALMTGEKIPSCRLEYSTRLEIK
jgi:hypothetical protein